MRLNFRKYSKKPRVHLRTHEGAPAVAISPEQALRRSVLSCACIGTYAGFRNSDDYPAGPRRWGRG